MSASLFRKTQLNNNQLYFSDLAQSLCSQKNIPPSIFSFIKPEQPISPKEEIFALSDIGSLDVLALNAPIYFLIFAPTFTKKLFKQFIKTYLKA